MTNLLAFFTSSIVCRTIVFPAKICSRFGKFESVLNNDKGGKRLIIHPVGVKLSGKKEEKREYIEVMILEAASQESERKCLE